MAYIGREPQIGNYQVCDAISVVNAQAAYTMQVSSVNVIPESVNHMIVSLNGVIQKPGSSYTISGATITFSRNLVTGETIDFIYLLGNVLDLGTPSDDTVTGAKIVDNAINSEHYTDASIDLAHLSADSVDGSKIADNAINSEHYTDGSIDTAHIADAQVTLAKLAADSVNATKIADDAISEEHLDVTAVTGHTAETSIADGDLILIHDASASALRKMTKANFVSGVGGANTPAFEATLGGSQAVADATITKLTFTSETFDSDGTFASSRFTPAVAGTYFVYFKALTDPAAYANENNSDTYFYKNGSNSGGFQTNFMTGGNASADGATAVCHTNHGIFVLDDNDYIEVYGAVNTHNGNNGNFKQKVFGGYRIII
jgi:hypothetical protein